MAMVNRFIRSALLIFAFSLLAVYAASAGSGLAAATGPAQAAPSITLTPISNYDQNPVTLSGSGFSAQDTSCTVTSSPAPNGAQIIGPMPSCHINSGQLAGIFYVASNNQPGQYTITVTGNSGDSASAPFTVESAQGSQSSQTSQTSQPGQVMTTAAVTSNVSVTSTATSTTITTITTSTTSVSTTNSTAGLVAGVSPDMNPTMVAVVVIVCACVGAAVVFVYMKPKSAGTGATKAQDNKTGNRSAFCKGCGGRLPNHYSPCPIGDAEHGDA